MKQIPDILDTPELKRRTQRVLALKIEQKQAKQHVAYIAADIGDELIATKNALTHSGHFKVFGRWLSSHVKFSRMTADEYMHVARLRIRCKNVLTFAEFAEVDLAPLYKIAALPDELLQKLVADPRLPDPKTGKPTPIEDMSDRDLIRALKLFRGRTGKAGKSKAPAPTDASKEARARAAIEAVEAVIAALEAVNAGDGKLSSATKAAMLDLLERLRAIVLHWKAWVTPEKHRRRVAR